MTTHDWLAAVKARAEKATPGPWTRDRNWWITAAGHDWERVWFSPGAALHNYDPTKDRRVCQIMGPQNGNSAVEDADFIAHAREDVPRLVAALAACTEALEKVMRRHSCQVSWDDDKSVTMVPICEGCGAHWPCEDHQTAKAVLTSLPGAPLQEKQ